ncbi:MAG: hypothetical protein NDI81_10215 [Desulfobacula sp.]|nr:hypothetical protein [Desulfobacula sp.]
MIEGCINFITWASIFLGFLSALCWFRASKIKVTREQEVDWRMKIAEKRAEKPNLAGITLDGWDMSGTFRVQTKWNSFGAFSGALAIMLQAIVRILEM